jgi:hypothetical protein
VVGVLAIAGCGGTPSPPVPSQPTETTSSQTAGGSVHPPGWGRPAPASVQRFALRPSIATATMYDSITLSTVPPSPFALAGYTSGFWPTYEPMRRTWPNAHTVSIAVTAIYHADCLDVEPGDATPSQAPGWVEADKAAGFARPCLYSSYYEWIEQLRPALARAGIALSRIFKWVASYVYHPQLLPGFDAQQWTDAAYGRNLDASLVLLPFLSIAQPPYVAPKPNRAKLIARREVLRYALLHYGCRHRQEHHEALGPKCKRWFAEGNRINRELAASS